MTPEEVVSGFHITISLPTPSLPLHGIINKALRVIEDRGKANKTKKFHEYAVPFGTLTDGVASDTKAEHMNKAGGKIESLAFRISPRFLGSNYP